MKPVKIFSIKNIVTATDKTLDRIVAGADPETATIAKMALDSFFEELTGQDAALGLLADDPRIDTALTGGENRPISYYDVF